MLSPYLSSDIQLGLPPVRLATPEEAAAHIALGRHKARLHAALDAVAVAEEAAKEAAEADRLVAHALLAVAHRALRVVFLTGIKAVAAA
jgi:hypothetical protein